VSGCAEEVADVAVEEDELEFEDEEDEEECERDRDASVSVVAGADEEMVAVLVDVEEAVEDAEGVRLCDEEREGDFGGRGGAEMEFVDTGMGILDGGAEAANLREGVERLARGRGRRKVAQNGDFVVVLDNGPGVGACLVGE
jgi:hypothetical protein